LSRGLLFCSGCLLTEHAFTTTPWRRMKTCTDAHLSFLTTLRLLPNEIFKTDSFFGERTTADKVVDTSFPPPPVGGPLFFLGKTHPKVKPRPFPPFLRCRHSGDLLLRFRCTPLFVPPPLVETSSLTAEPIVVPSPHTAGSTTGYRSQQ